MSRKSNKVGCRVLAAMLCAISVVTLASLAQARVGDAAGRPALIASAFNPTVWLGAAVAANHRLVAVGERGRVMVSDDGGVSWRQVPVPVSVTLTAVRFAGVQGVAVGHGGVVLTSEDNGDTWGMRLDGRQVAELALQAATASHDVARIEDAQRLVDEGPDKPFLDVAIDPQGRLVVVGAYGMMVVSLDRGLTWSVGSERLNNPDGLHLYAIRQRGHELLLAGERGLVLHSTDDGATFQRLAIPYHGSLFTAELVGDREIVVAGLKGSLLRSRDEGASWSRLNTSDTASVTGSTLSANGQVLLVNQAGHVFDLRADGLQPLNTQAMAPLNAVVSLNPGRAVLLSNSGLTSLTLDPHGGGLK